MQQLRDDTSARKNAAEAQAEKIPAAGLSTARRWEDRPIEEKIEALRHEVRTLRETLDYVTQQAHEARNNVESHQHSSHDGRAVVPVAVLGRAALIGVSDRYDPLA